MVAHVAGNAGGPPPPSEREARLLAELEACQAELRAAREVVEEYRGNRLHLTRNGIITGPSAALAAYDKVAGGMTR